MTVKRMNFEKVVNIKIAVGFVLALLGIATLGLMVSNIINVFTTDLLSKHESFTSGFYSGIGAALVLCGFGMSIKSIILKRNKEKYKKAEIEYNDERNTFIINTTFCTSFIVSLFLILVATIIFGMINYTVFITLIGVLLLSIVVMVITYTIVNIRH